MIWADIVKNWKPIAIVLGALALVALTVFGIRSGLNTINEMVEARATAVREERDAFWKAEIARSNAKAAAAMAEQALKVAGLEAVLSASSINVQAQFDQLEKSDAALPDGDAVGLDAARVGLLPRKAED